MELEPLESPGVVRRPRLRLRVSRVAESQIRQGHPWVYSESIRDLNRDGESGELAVIYDRSDRFLAVGFYDPDSPIRVRILHRGKPHPIGKAWFEERFKHTLGLRAGLFGPGSSGLGLVSTRDSREVDRPSWTSSVTGQHQTTGYRLINGESDGWPALVLDRYGATSVLKLYSTIWLSRLDPLLTMAARNLEPEGIVLRLSRNIQAAAEERYSKQDGQVVMGPPIDAPVTFLENGIRFEADVVRGQKTGFFLDQRENRKQVETLAANRRVLNAFSFSGGFSLYAARGGARSVTDLDLSQHALDSAQRNVALNQGEPRIVRCDYRQIRADAFEWLAQSPDREFDLIILDPPSLARRESERARAIRAYERLALDATRWLTQGGVLYASSCSAHVSANEFFEAVRTAARRSGRRFRELATTRHAPDHPATFAEAWYLKGIYLRFHDSAAE